MTPTILQELPHKWPILIAPFAQRQIAAFDPETTETVQEGIVHMLLDFLAYATAFQQQRIAELLIDEPQLAALGEVLFDGIPGLALDCGDLFLWFSFDLPAIVLEGIIIAPRA